MISQNFSHNLMLDDNYKKLTKINKYNYNSVTFDGCYYYFTMVCKLLIVQMDTDFNIIKVFDTYKKYDKIIYDPVLECFWATRSKGCRFIYKLDKNFIELDDICVRNYAGRGAINGLSYDCYNDKLIVSFPQAIVSVNKSTCESETLHTSYENWITDVICIHPYFFEITVSQTGKKLAQLKDIDGVLELEKVTDLPNNFNIEGMTFKKVEINEDIDVLVTFEILTIYDCGSYLYETTSTFEEICSCNEWVNDGNCDECDCCEETCKLIEALAEIELGIANVLNAEGEKIQYAIANSSSVLELVRINNSVSITVEKITELERLIIDILDKM